MSENIVVAVRVRPFNDREKALSAKCCVDMVGSSTIIRDLDGSKEEKTFTFDHSFWSHDEFVQDENGVLVPTSEKYADQKKVFSVLGTTVLNNAWAGYHCCLFMYGQTGSGKSYSMIGYGNNKGCVPLVCEDLFKRVSAGNSESTTKQFEISVSMLEIYNEQVQDLLIDPSKRPKKGLDIHESKQFGVYVEELSKRPVTSYAAIEQVIEEGTSNRTVGSTLMNATSSRAHTVITIEFKQITTASNGLKGTKLAVINLVDLAGSEKAGQTGASGDRLKEGCAINKSLSALGNVISALADKATGAAASKAAVVPYRDSKLTRLLQNALGGNSRTIMVCAISPASSNYEESVSTLRYADRAKRIKNSATVNEDPQERLIRQLREENERLKALIGSGGGAGAMASPESDAMRKTHEEEIRAMEAQLREFQTSFAQKIAEAETRARESASAKTALDLSKPHMTNLNEDPLLSGKIHFVFASEGETLIGRANHCQVKISGLGVAEEHAVVKVEHAAGDWTLLLKSLTGGAGVFVNGQQLTGEARKLEHGDRLIFGQNNLFVFVDPSKTPLHLESGTFSFAAAKKELAEQQGDLAMKTPEQEAAERAKAAEFERKLQEAEEARRLLAEEAKQQEAEYKRQLAALASKSEGEREAAMAEIKNAMQLAEKRKLELERKAEELQAQEEERKRREIEAKMLDEQLMVVLPLCKEATLIAKELGKLYVFKTKLQVKALDAKRRRTDLVIQVFFEDKHVYDWNAETLENRVFLMRDLFERFCEDPASLAVLTDEDDPFYDPVQTEKFIGSARILLESLTMQLETEVDSKILSTEGRPVGTLHCEIWPLSKAGDTVIPDEEIVDEPQALLGQSLAFKLSVRDATGLPHALNNNVRVEYRFYLDEQVYQLNARGGGEGSSHTAFNYERVFHVDVVTQRLLDYFREEAITFNIFGNSTEAEQVAQVRKTRASIFSEPTSPVQRSSVKKESTPTPAAILGSASAAPAHATAEKPQDLHPQPQPQAQERRAALRIVKGPVFEHKAVKPQSSFCAIM